MRSFARTGKRNPLRIVTKFCMSVDIHDIITCATFCDDRLRGLGVAMGRISSFPIDWRRRPYNTRTTVRVCDKDAAVMSSVFAMLSGV